MSHIPINAARAIAEKYDWDQVIVIARKVGEGGGEHCTTYGVNKDNCKVAADIGDFLKHKIMGWKPVKPIITVRVEGGMVTDVHGIPAGYELRVEDYDHSDDSQPTWDAEKQCFVTVYRGDGV